MRELVFVRVFGVAVNPEAIEAVVERGIGSKMILASGAVVKFAETVEQVLDELQARVQDMAEIAANRGLARAAAGDPGPIGVSRRMDEAIADLTEAMGP